MCVFRHISSKSRAVDVYIDAKSLHGLRKPLKKLKLKKLHTSYIWKHITSFASVSSATNCWRSASFHKSFLDICHQELTYRGGACLDRSFICGSATILTFSQISYSLLIPYAILPKHLKCGTNSKVHVETHSSLKHTLKIHWAFRQMESLFYTGFIFNSKAISKQYFLNYLSHIFVTVSLYDLSNLMSEDSLQSKAFGIKLPTFCRPDL